MSGQVNEFTTLANWNAWRQANPDKQKRDDSERRKRRRIQRKARRLLEELECTQLEVVLVPDRRPDDYGGQTRMLRAVQTENPEWYQKFCKLYPSRRRDRLRWAEDKTAIKRAHTLRALRELASGRCETIYAQRLLSFIENKYA